MQQDLGIYCVGHHRPGAVHERFVGNMDFVICIENVNFATRHPRFQNVTRGAVIYMWFPMYITLWHYESRLVDLLIDRLYDMFKTAYVPGETKTLESVLPSYWFVDVELLRAIFFPLGTCSNVDNHSLRPYCQCEAYFRSAMTFVLLLLETTDERRHFVKVHKTLSAHTVT